MARFAKLRLNEEFSSSIDYPCYNVTSAHNSNSIQKTSRRTRNKFNRVKYSRKDFRALLYYHSNLSSHLSSTHPLKSPFHTLAPSFTPATTLLKSLIIPPGPLAYTVVDPWIVASTNSRTTARRSGCLISAGTAVVLPLLSIVMLCFRGTDGAQSSISLFLDLQHPPAPAAPVSPSDDEPEEDGPDFSLTETLTLPVFSSDMLPVPLVNGSSLVM